jgi:hypothetical protein
MIFNPIDVLSFRRNDDADTPCYLIFSNIVAEALDNLYFRRFNYKKVVSYKSVIARLLHRRISHHFTQSNPKLTYSVNFSTLLRDFGLEYPTLAKAYIKLKEALGEMKDANVIQEFTCEPIRNSRDARKFEDYFVKITPTQAFSFEVKNSNDIRINISRMRENSEDLSGKSSKKSKKSTSFFPDSVGGKAAQDK